MSPLRAFRRGVNVAACLLVGLQAFLFGAWLMHPAATFRISPTYILMGQIAPELEWGVAFAGCGAALLLAGLGVWFRLWETRPYPTWLRALIAAVLSLKLALVVSIFYLAAKQSTATPVFFVMLLGTLVVLVSALDEMDVWARLTRRGR